MLPRRRLLQGLAASPLLALASGVNGAAAPDGPGLHRWRAADAAFGDWALAGTRLEADGLVTHTAAGGRKVYGITDSGRSELRARADELAQLEAEIHSSAADLAALAEQVEAGVRGSVRDLKRELRDARHAARTAPWSGFAAGTGGAEEPAMTPAPPTSGPPVAGPQASVVRKAAELAADVTRLVGLGRASTEDLRVASTVLDSVRDQLRHILRG